jgi:hypothetical protein
MHARYEGVHSGDQMLVGRRNQQCAVIANTQRHVGTLAALGSEIAVNQGEFRGRHDQEGIPAE